MLRIRVVVGLTATLVCAGLARRSLGSGCPGSPEQSPGPDIIVTGITGVFNFPAIGTRDAFSLGSDACNLGDQEAMWDACPATTHPVFGGNLYKWYSVNFVTRFEQVGQSWLKHGFAADQEYHCCDNCQPSGDFRRLGRGCSDAYSASQAGQQSSLSPKYLVNAHTGAYTNELCSVRASGGNTGRLEVEIADLVVSDGTWPEVRYFGQSQYTTFDDALFHNQNNNASTCEIAVSRLGSEWNFTISGMTEKETPAIRLWKTLETDVVETDVDTEEDDGYPGLVIMAAKATDLGNGVWHYEYAVNNLNSDRSIGGFSVPCSMYAMVQNIGFRDVDYHGGDGMGGVNYDGADWPGSFANGAVSWATTPFATDNNANAIRWGTLYNFRFDANIPPASGNVTLTEFKVVTDLLAATVIPSAVNCTKGDMNADGLIDGRDIALFAQLLVSGGATPAQKCTGDVQPVPNYALDEADVDPFINCLLSGGCP